MRPCRGAQASFGELALLRDAPRAASIIAESTERGRQARLKRQAELRQACPRTPPLLA